MSAFQDQQRDTGRLRQRADQTDRERTRDLKSDVVIEDPRRLFLRSPDGTYFALSIDNAGVLSATNMGPDPL